jgi:hypothetical protein
MKIITILYGKAVQYQIIILAFGKRLLNFCQANGHELTRLRVGKTSSIITQCCQQETVEKMLT